VDYKNKRESKRGLSPGLKSKIERIEKRNKNEDKDLLDVNLNST